MIMHMHKLWTQIVHALQLHFMLEISFEFYLHCSFKISLTYQVLYLWCLLWRICRISANVCTCSVILIKIPTYQCQYIPVYKHVMAYLSYWGLDKETKKMKVTFCIPISKGKNCTMWLILKVTIIHYLIARDLLLSDKNYALYINLHLIMPSKNV